MIPLLKKNLPLCCLVFGLCCLCACSNEDARMEERLRKMDVLIEMMQGKAFGAARMGTH